MGNKKVEYYEIEIEEDGKKFKGDVRVEGTRKLYPTVYYGARVEIGNPFSSDEIDSMLSYCRTILQQFVREELDKTKK